MNTTRHILLGTLVALTTAACTVGPNFKRPDPPADKAYSQSMPKPDPTRNMGYGGDVAADWYRLFH